jgi:uncharacterized membrane protein
MLVPFPIVCFLGTFFADIMFVSESNLGWEAASKWLLGFGLGFAVLAAIAGLVDFFGDPTVRGHSDAVKHMLANMTAVGLEAVNLFFRLGDPDFIRMVGIYISGIVVLILLYSGWKGGALVFRHGVGVLDKHSR